MEAREVRPSDAVEWFRLRDRAWPGEAEEKHAEQINGYLANDDPSYKVFVADAGDGKLAGMIEVSLRESGDGNIEKNWGKIEGLSTHPGVNFKEVVGLLLDTAVDWLRAHDPDVILSRCDSDDEALTEMFLEKGFAVDYRQTYFRMEI